MNGVAPAGGHLHIAKKHRPCRCISPQCRPPWARLGNTTRPTTFRQEKEEQATQRIAAGRVMRPSVTLFRSVPFRSVPRGMCRRTSDAARFRHRSSEALRHFRPPMPVGDEPGAHVAPLCHVETATAPRSGKSEHDGLDARDAPDHTGREQAPHVAPQAPHGSTAVAHRARPTPRRCAVHTGTPARRSVPTTSGPPTTRSGVAPVTLSTSSAPRTEPGTMLRRRTAGCGCRRIRPR